MKGVWQSKVTTAAATPDAVLMIILASLLNKAHTDNQAHSTWQHILGSFSTLYIMFGGFSVCLQVAFSTSMLIGGTLIFLFRPTFGCKKYLHNAQLLIPANFCLASQSHPQYWTKMIASLVTPNQTISMSILKLRWRLHYNKYGIKMTKTEVRQRS